MPFGGQDQPVPGFSPSPGPFRPPLAATFPLGLCVVRFGPSSHPTCSPVHVWAQLAFPIGSFSFTLSRTALPESPLIPCLLWGAGCLITWGHSPCPPHATLGLRLSCCCRAAWNPPPGHLQACSLLRAPPAQAPSRPALPPAGTALFPRHPVVLFVHLPDCIDMCPLGFDYSHTPGLEKYLSDRQSSCN